jgi:hypothetical protein
MNIAVEAATISVRAFMVWLLERMWVVIGLAGPSSVGVAFPQLGRRPIPVI